MNDHLPLLLNNLARRFREEFALAGNLPTGRACSLVSDMFSPYSLSLAESRVERLRVLRFIGGDQEYESPGGDWMHLLESPSTNQPGEWNFLVARGARHPRQADPILGATLIYFPPDDSANLFPPVCLPNFADRERLCDQLIQAALTRARIRECLHLQCLLGHAEQELAGTLARNGVSGIGNLWLMQRPAGRLSKSQARLPHPAAKLVPINEECDSPQLAELLQATYRDSRDFPQLVHDRTGQTALKTHRWQGQFDPRLWFWICRGECPVGVLLLSTHSNTGQRELIYLGILPEFRRQGWGRYAMESILSNQEFAERSFFLGVDALNHSAIELYESCGFVREELQRVHFLSLRNRAS